MLDACVIHIKVLKMDLEKILEKVNNVIEFNQKSMVEALHRHEYRIEKKGQKWFWERLLQADEQFSVWKGYGKHNVSQRH